jgi:excinuclease UvrABC ATPase subunit
MLASDYLMIWTWCRAHGGELVAHGPPAEFLKLSSLTADYLNEKKNMKYLRRGGKAMASLFR